MADTLDSIAFVYTESGDYPRAIDHYEQALAVYRQIGDTHGEALSLLNLGDAQHAASHAEAAGRSWQRALGRFAKLHFRTSYEVVAAAGKLDELPLPVPPEKTEWRR